MIENINQHLRTVTTEAAVLGYLTSKHHGFEITLIWLEWK